MVAKIEVHRPLGLVFPGQGSQSIGMGLWAYERSQKAKELAQSIENSLNFSITKLMFQGPEDTLRETRHTQVAIFTASLMMLAVLEGEFGEELLSSVKACAGHSVGEYAALTAAQVLPLGQALSLLKARAEAMEDASPKDKDGHTLGAMCVLLGCSVELVQELLARFVDDPKACCLANDNGPGQVVISGTFEGVEAIRAHALEAGAKRGVRLNVSGPFHSPWMSSVEALLKDRVESLTFNGGRFPVVANVTAKPVESPEDWKRLLPRQVTHPVLWRKTMETFVQQFHVETCIEVGSGNVLSNLGRRCSDTCTFLTVEEMLKV